MKSQVPQSKTQASLHLMNKWRYDTGACKGKAGSYEAMNFQQLQKEKAQRLKRANKGNTRLYSKNIHTHI